MLGYQPYVASDALTARHPYEGPLHAPLSATQVTLPYEARALVRLVPQVTAELGAIELLIERCTCPQEAERVLELGLLDRVCEVLKQTSLEISLVSKSAQLLALLARNLHAREKICDHTELVQNLTRVLLLTKNQQISDLFFVLSQCPRTAFRLVSVLDSIRLALEISAKENSRTFQLLCACAARVVDACPSSADVFVNRKLLSEISHFDFLAALGRASSAARLELLADSPIVEISAHVLANSPRLAPLRLLEALAIEPEGKFSVTRHATGVLAHLAVSTEMSPDFRSTLHRVIRSVAEFPTFLENFVEILQGEGALLREIFGNLALKPLCALLPSSLALNSFHEILTQPANAVMLAHFVCPRAAWHSPREFAISECVSVQDKLHACGSDQLALNCLRILQM